MDDLIAFMKARLDEREAVALAAQGTTEGRWTQDEPDRAPGRIVDDYDDFVTYDEGAPSQAQGRHIAGNDPIRVLADVAAKRQIIEFALDNGTGLAHANELINGEYNDDMQLPARLLKLLALPDAGHPDYREEWKL